MQTCKPVWEYRIWSHIFPPHSLSTEALWSLLILYWSLWLYKGSVCTPGHTQSISTSNKLLTHLHQHTYWQHRGDQQIQQLSFFNHTMPTPWLGHLQIRPCKSVALSLGPLRYNTSKAIRTVTQALLRPSPYQQDSIYWQMQDTTSIYRLLHFSPSTHCTLHTSEISHQCCPYHIKSTFICLYDLLHTYHVNLL